MTKEIFFDALTAADVAERLRALNELNAYLNAVVLTYARAAGCGPADQVQLNREGTGVVVTSPDAPELETQPGSGGVTAEMAVKRLRDASKKMAEQGFKAADLSGK